MLRSDVPPPVQSWSVCNGRVHLTLMREAQRRVEYKQQSSGIHKESKKGVTLSQAKGRRKAPVQTVSRVGGGATSRACRQISTLANNYEFRECVANHMFWHSAVHLAYLADQGSFGMFYSHGFLL